MLTFNVCLCSDHRIIPLFNHVCSLCRVWLFATPLMEAHQAPLSMEFSRQEGWRGPSFPSPGIVPIQGWNPCLLCLASWQAGSSPPAPHPQFLKCVAHTPWPALLGSCWFSCLQGGEGASRPAGWWSIPLLPVPASLSLATSSGGFAE